MSDLAIKLSDASTEMFNKGDNKKMFIDVYNYLAKRDYEKMILNFENGASMTVEIHEPPIRLNLSKELIGIVHCKNCIHRPIKGEDVYDIDPPKDSRGYADHICPCLNGDEDDYWYPSDDWFCAEGEAKGDEDESNSNDN